MEYAFSLDDNGAKPLNYDVQSPDEIRDLDRNIAYYKGQL